ncbi:hypothetical protein OU426_02475 [Frigidibacter sp. RF13]|uniref:hypothetical protein n=1 Tax=Frigidibacter sp. RF13 TaxID=2997340 RepID=UPI00226FEA19|nr:hypothetical protein [Frigidibacter sp. RF13]MCY1125708.1 hypothetical protein [Frigidibacter sp. RF13]
MGRMASTRRAASESGGGNDPLDYWLEQERQQGLDDAEWVAGDKRLPSGWWLLPVMVMALPLWGFLIWMAFLR